MSGFGDLLRRGKKVFRAKEQGVWGRCDECNTRALLYKYTDKKGEEWTFCENCIDFYAKEEC